MSFPFKLIRSAIAPFVAAPPEVLSLVVGLAGANTSATGAGPVEGGSEVNVRLWPNWQNGTVYVPRIQITNTLVTQANFRPVSLTSSLLVTDPGTPTAPARVNSVLHGTLQCNEAAAVAQHAALDIDQKAWVQFDPLQCKLLPLSLSSYTLPGGNTHVLPELWSQVGCPLPPSSLADPPLSSPTAACEVDAEWPGSATSWRLTEVRKDGGLDADVATICLQQPPSNTSAPLNSAKTIVALPDCSASAGEAVETEVVCQTNDLCQVQTCLPILPADGEEVTDGMDVLLQEFNLGVDFIQGAFVMPIVLLNGGV